MDTSMKRGRRMLIAFASIVVTLAVTGALVSCYPGDQLTIAEADMITTVYNPDANFKALTSYALADSVIHLVPEGQEDDISRAYDDLALTTVRSNLDGLGFTEVLDPATADVIVTLAVTAADYTSYYSYSPCYYYCWYYPYPPGWGWGYPPAIGAYSYRVGTIFIHMALRANPDPDDDNVFIAWVAAMNGLSDKSTNGTRIKNGINQAFAQSKYLGAGK